MKFKAEHKMTCHNCNFSILFEIRGARTVLDDMTIRCNRCGETLKVLSTIIETPPGYKNTVIEYP